MCRAQPRRASLKLKTLTERPSLHPLADLYSSYLSLSSSPLHSILQYRGELYLKAVSEDLYPFYLFFMLFYPSLPLDLMLICLSCFVLFFFPLPSLLPSLLVLSSSRIVKVFKDTWSFPLLKILSLTIYYKTLLFFSYLYLLFVFSFLFFC